MGGFNVFLANESEQLSLAAELAHHAPAGTVIFLQGDLGAGKTTLVRGFLQALGHVGAVKSPTYTLVEPYEINGQGIYHFDLYRLGEPDELEYAGGRDYFDGESICLIEWPEKAAGYLPVADLLCELAYETRNGVQGRACKLQAGTEKGDKIIADLSN
ncbi:MAG TPA: tRNA (adenosine(37)-N6)-threonylcarbamoyltransferase complex ATPase subunit type 1 TsaE [Gammaproteobacteria bacterium]